jgi:hypothetical protein
MAYKIEYILLIGILAFLLYHLLGSCNCNDGFSVGGKRRRKERLTNEINSLEGQILELKGSAYCDPTATDPPQMCPGNIECPQCSDQSCLCPDPINPHGFTPISIEDITKSKSGAAYYINADEILIILKSNGSQTLEIAGARNLYILGNIYIENGATLNINNFQVYYNDASFGSRDPRDMKSAATIINNGNLNISNPLGTVIFSGVEMRDNNISKLTNNGIITFNGTDPGSINAHKSESHTGGHVIHSSITYTLIDITGIGEIIYNNAGISYDLSVNIDNTQTFNKCTINSVFKSLSFNKSLTLNMSSFYINKDMTILAPAKITIDKSYMYSDTGINFTSDNMTITGSNMMFYLQLNITNITMDKSNLTVMNKANINSEVIILKNESKLIIDKEWSGGQFKIKNMTMDDTSSIMSK